MMTTLSLGQKVALVKIMDIDDAAAFLDAVNKETEGNITQDKLRKYNIKKEQLRDTSWHRTNEDRDRTNVPDHYEVMLKVTVICYITNYYNNFITYTFEHHTQRRLKDVMNTCIYNMLYKEYEEVEEERRKPDRTLYDGVMSVTPRMESDALEAMYNMAEDFIRKESIPLRYFDKVCPFRV